MTNEKLTFIGLAVWLIVAVIIAAGFKLYREYESGNSDAEIDDDDWFWILGYPIGVPIGIVIIIVYGTGKVIFSGLLITGRRFMKPKTKSELAKPSSVVNSQEWGGEPVPTAIHED